MANLNKYQESQKKYVEELEQKITQNGWEPFNIDIECKGCKVTENFVNAPDAVKFIEAHAQHFTWVTNKNAQRK